MENKLLKILKLEGSEFNTAFSKASFQGFGTPQEIAEFRERYFNKFIAKYFPYPHRVTKSQIIDSFGYESNSIDCVVLNPNHPYIVDIEGKFNVVLADGVDVAIELKPDVANKAELLRGLEQINSIKKLTRRESPLVMNRSPELVKLSQKIPSFIFSLKAKADPRETVNEIAEFYLNNNIEPEEQIDFVIINEVGIIANYKHPRTSIVLDNRIGFFYEEWLELTLAAFIMKLYSVFHATPTIGTPILRHYLSSFKPYQMFHYDEKR